MRRGRTTAEIWKASLLCALALSAAGCAPASSGGGQRLRIVSSLPLTGSSRTQSETMVRAIQMALDEAGHRAGRYQIDYSSWDDATAQAGTWDPAREKDNATRAAADPQVVAYLGTYNSGAAKIAIPILNKAGLVMVGPGATASQLTKPGMGEPNEPDIYYPSGKRNFCRVVPADDLQGAAAAWWAQSLGVRSVYVLDDKEFYGKGLARVFEASCRARGIEIKGHEGIDTKASDFRSVVSKVRASGAELVYFGGTTQNGSGKLAKDLREGGSSAIFMGADATKEKAFLESAGPAAEGTLVTLGGSDLAHMAPEGQAWYARYQKKFGQRPEAYTIYAYEAAKVTLAGIARADSADRSAILRAIMGTRDFHGVLGAWSFDEQGDTTLSAMSGYEVVHGDWAFSAALKPSDPVAHLKLVTPRGAAQTESASVLRAFAEQLLNGLTNGSLIAVIALGYTLVYGIVELINFAHGDVFMMGSMAALTLVSALGLGPLGIPLALLGAMLGAALLNRAIDQVAYRRLRGGSRLVPLITAIGVSFVLMNLGGYWKGWAPVYFPDLLGKADVNLLGPVHFKVSQLLVIALSWPLMLALQWFIARTRLGQAMRATAQNPQAAALMGIDVNRTIGAAFLIGGALAGAAGFLYGFYHHEVRFDLGFRQGLNAFTAAVLGGIGNVRGALLGGLIIGLTEALTAYYWAQAVAPAVVFALLVLVILLKPSGLLGANLPEKV